MTVEFILMIVIVMKYQCVLLNNSQVDYSNLEQN